MAKRLNKITPIATSVALSLGLTGCFSDNDNNEKVVNPPQPISKEVTQTANFNVTVSGKAVKGILNGALVSVQTINDAGELEDVAYRTQPGEVSVTGKATTEEEAKQKANEALLADNPSELKTNAKGVYSIVVDESFSGPLHITVKATKDSDALVKCDAFVGCGQGQDIDGNNNGRIEFGEWYKDDVELSVVKLLSKPSTVSSKSKSQPQFADGDNNQYKANVTIFTSTAAKILLKAAGEKKIDSVSISDASTKVIETLIGDTALAASLTGDISLGGAVDFTDVDSGDSLDAGSLTLIQVAASIQAVASKGSKSIDEVLAEINTGIEAGTLEQSETFTEVKKEAKSAGSILAAAVSGDEDKLKTALVEAGISEEDVSEVAKTVKETKDKAVENSGTNEDDLKKDVEDAKDKLGNIGNNENETENNVLLEDLGLISDALSSVKSVQSELNKKLDEIKELSVDIETREKAIEYFAAAQNLHENVLVQVVNGTIDTESLVSILNSQKGVLTTLKERAESLVIKDSQYQDTLDLANELLAENSSAAEVNEILSTDSQIQINNATSQVELFASIIDALEEAANLAIAALVESQAQFNDKKESYTSVFDSAIEAEVNIKGIDSANDAIDKIKDAIEKLSEVSPLAVKFVQLASSASSSTAAFSSEAASQNTKIEVANALVEKVAELVDSADESLAFSNSQSELLDNLLVSSEAKKKKFEDEEAVRNAENTALVERISDTELKLDSVRATVSELIAALSDLESLLPADKKFATNEDAIEFYGKAINLKKAYDAKVLNGTESTSVILSEQSELLAQYKLSAETLVAANDVYEPTLNRIEANLESVENIKESQKELLESITENVDLADEAVEDFILLAKQGAFYEAKLNLESKKSDYDSAAANLENLIQEADIAFNDINSLDTANAAVKAYESAIEFLNETVKSALTSFSQLAVITKEAADEYRVEADKQQKNVADASAAQSDAAIHIDLVGVAETKQASDLSALQSRLETALEQQKDYQTQKDNSELNDQIKLSIDELNNRTSDGLSRVSDVRAELDSVVRKGINADTEVKVTEYFNAAFALSSDFTENEKDQLLVSTQNYLNQAEALLSSAVSLANQNSDYASTKEAAQALVDVLKSQIINVSELHTLIQTELEKATQKAEEFDIEVEVAKAAAEKAYQDTLSAKAEFELSKSAFEDSYLQAISAFNAIDKSSSSAQRAIDALADAKEKFNSYIDSVTSFESAANTALMAVNAYLDILGSESSSSITINILNSDGSELTPDELLAEVNKLLESSSSALEIAETDERDEEISGLEARSEELKQELSNNEFVSSIAREGTEKVVTASYITKEGADAIYGVGEVIFDVVKDIIDNGNFNTGKQSGRSTKFPEWQYTYDTDAYSFVFENVNDGQKLEAEGSFLSSSQSKFVLTWSGNILAESGEKVVISAPDLQECEAYAITGDTDKLNASCAVVHFDGRVSKFEDAKDVNVLRVSSFNIAELKDGKYGFDGIVQFDVFGLDENGNPKGLFSSGDVIEYASFVVEGTESVSGTTFNTTFDVKYDDIHEEIGTAKVSITDFNGFQWKVDLVNEVGPLLGEVSIYNGIEGKDRTVAGAIREITNGFNIVYIDGQSVDYTDINFVSERK